MGFFFRKSVRFGPVRVNFSKSGVGTSIGFKGARLTSSAKGSTYVTVGRRGFYYRQSLSPNRQEGRQLPMPASQPPPVPTSSPSPGAILTADVSALTDVTSAEVVKQLNERARVRNAAPLAYGAAFLSVMATAISGNALWLLLSAGCVVLGLVLHRRCRVRRSSQLVYELDEVEKNNFNLIQQGVSHLAQTNRVWRIEAKLATDDQKHNAGASSLLNRAKAVVGPNNIPNVKTNLEVLGIDLGSIKLFFLPDLILYWQANTFAAIPYASLRVTQAQTRFIEDESVPGDATVVDTTWRYVNKSGGPDRRFKDNRQLPIVLYGKIELTTPSGLNIHLQTSSADKALAFTNCLHERLSRTRSKASEPA
jgi:Protein of unknown function (DUF4236)